MSACCGCNDYRDREWEAGGAAQMNARYRAEHPPLSSIDSPQRREMPSLDSIIGGLGTVIVGGVLLLLAMGIPGYLLFSVIFGGGCSMQGGTC
jgi:hypothetical protein